MADAQDAFDVDQEIEGQEFDALCRKGLLSILNQQTQIARALKYCSGPVAADLGELFEDVGNRLIDVSESISQRLLAPSH